MDTTRILVPVDLPDTSPALVDAAARFARAHGLGLELLYVLDVAVLVRPELRMGMATTSAPTVQGMAYAQAERQLALLAHRPALEDLEVRTRVELGDATECILRNATADRPAYIAMGTHGRTGAARMLLGSVAQKVVALAPCPVLTWRLELLTHGAEAGRSAA